VGAPLDATSFREFGPYRLKRMLGEGGMGVVWLAERADAGNLVAIKFLPHAGLSPARRERFAREIKTLAKLKHPFIARLYDAGTLADGTPWFVMEFVEGERFGEYCRRPERTVEECLRLFRRVCEAVQYAHGQEIIHRDLKPSNILVEQDGTPRLLDFGIARQLQTLDELTDQTRQGLRFMSPDYAAPEWVRDGTVGFYTDVYSLGVILYEMLTGALPFDRPKGFPERAPNHAAEHGPEKPSALVSRRSAHAMAGASSLGRAAWGDLDVLCLTAMHKDANRRYQSAEALIRDIDHFQNSEPLEARPDSLRYTAGKFIRRNREPLSIAALIFALVVGLVIFFTMRLARARDAAVAETARTQRVERFMFNLFEGGDQQAAPSSDLRVATLLGRGAQQAAALNSDPETQVELYETLGGIYLELGNYQKAGQLLRSGLDKAKTAFGPESPKFASALVQLGRWHADQGQYQDAGRLISEGMDIAGRHLPADDPTVLDAKANLARVLLQSGSTQRAIPLLESVIEVKPSGEAGNYVLRESLTALGVAEYYAGHYKTAEAVGRRAVALDTRLLGTLHPKTGAELMNVGTDAAALGQYAEAESLYREGVNILNAWYGPNHPDTATSMAILASTLIQEGKDTEAESLLNQVLKIQERIYGSVHDRVAFTLDMLGRTAMKRGNPADAQADFSRAVAIDHVLLGDKSPRTAALKVDLADAYILQAKYVEAEDILRKAIPALVQSLPAGDAHIGSAYASLGRALLHLKRYREAETQLTTAYQILEKQPRPPVARIQDVRRDLVTVYDALDEPDKAKQFRTEHAGSYTAVAKVANIK
jgi:serine/threonine protein kinase/tetratricopeptide (TPR) repeat protein